MNNKNSRPFILLLLGLLTAFAPFVTDMYLPALPSMTGYFNCDITMVQLGLTFSMLGLAFGQLFFGPLSDKIGRRPPLLAAMVLYFIATLACIYAPSIEIFVFMRLIQGLAASGGLVISRSIAIDKFSGAELAKALAIVGAINGLAPVAAPIIGGSLCGITGWKGIFVVLMLQGVILLAMCLKFEESLPKEKRSSENFNKVFRVFKKALQNRSYSLWVLQMASAQAVLFGYIAASPFIIQEHYGYSALGFSIFFAINAIGIGCGAALAVKFSRLEDCVLTSCLGMSLGSLLLTGSLVTQAPIAVFAALMFATLVFTGMTFTAATALAMNEAREYAGTGSAILGASCFLVGSLVSPLVGLGNIMVSTGLTLTAGALISLGFCLAARRKITANKPRAQMEAA